MQGKKVYHEKLFSSFQLSQRVPKENFYRRLKEVLDLSFLYSLTKPYYGSCGQKSIDPVVFYKLCLVGYLENIISDRQVIEHCSLRLDILYFLGFDIDEELPWHSTLSRTRQLFPEAVFEEVFTHVLSLCIDRGMVAGHSQAIDSAPVKANASMDSLELKVPEEELDEHIRRVRNISSMDKPYYDGRKAKTNKASRQQRSITAAKHELQGIKSRTKKWAKDQDTRQGSRHSKSKYTSNKTHYSPTDPDARISVKPGKARKLNYHGNISVDTAHHVITDAKVYHADLKDSQYLQDVIMRLKSRLWQQGLIWRNVLADAGYSSGENYDFLERQNLVSYIPQHGTYKGGPEGFTFVGDENHWLCPQGKKVTFRKRVLVKNSLQDHYLTKRSDCKNCPIKKQCIGKSYEKRIGITIWVEQYERNNKRVKSRFGRYMKSKRQSTVEPVWGTLTQFMGLRKINTIGIAQANKVMHLAAMAYNLKKLLKYEAKKAATMAAAIALCFSFLRQKIKGFKALIFPELRFC
ncbi:IS1182 family transposase [Draconibacterium sediminis]|uniref:IS1182 family transposase n=1 Tax=Draconibacterium sediminis TaxID=1544798 RepID=UPI0026EBDC58|nr:IS1182 family transposase [Draconibacterium sediminis]